MAKTLVIIARHVPRHLARSVPQSIQELIVNKRHKPQDRSARALRLIVHTGSCQRQ